MKRRSWKTLALVGAQLPCAIAYAAPPSFTQQPIQVEIPTIGSLGTAFNLRDQGVLAGTGPIRANGVNGANSAIQATVLVNGQPEPQLTIESHSPYQDELQQVAGVCLRLRNSGYTPGPNDTFAVQLGFVNREGPVTAIVPISNTLGSTIGDRDETCEDGLTRPVADPGAQQTIDDTDQQPGENFVVNASQSSDADGPIVSYELTIYNSTTTTLTGTQPTFNVRLEDGFNQLQLQVTDADGLVSMQAFTFVTVNPVVNQLPVAQAGADIVVPESDQQPGELVTLDGTASSDPDGTIVSYEWREGGTVLGAGPTLQTTLSDGSHQITLVVTDNRGDTASDDVLVTVQGVAANQPPVAAAGPDRSIGSSDSQPGEVVTLDGSQSSDPDGTIVSYIWRNEQQVEIANGATPTLRLSDGTNVITLTVTDDGELSATDTVVITINAGQAPVANAGPDQVIADTDGSPGETVTLNGTANDADGTIASYEWLLGSNSLGTGATLQVSLPDGVSIVTLRVTDNDGNINTDTVQITINAPAERPSLAELPGLPPGRRSMATTLDRMCAQLDQLNRNEAALSGDQQDLLRKCDGIYFNNTAANQIQAMEELTPEDFAVARTQTLLFANTQYTGVMDRLMALRGGAKGASLAGLNITIDGQSVPLSQLYRMASELLGGGASSDADEEPGGLLSDKWGLWMRGNYSFGGKDKSLSSPSFDVDQYALIGGIDYRLSNTAVLGAALSYGDASVEFNPIGEGGMDTASWALSLYGSAYAAGSFYLDAIANASSSSFDAKRNITYVDGRGLVNTSAAGDTDGLTLSVGVSTGYDFVMGGLTLAPSLGVHYIDATIDGFAETGAGGLNLLYDEQNFSSLTGNVGLRMEYAWKLRWGVLLPQLRTDYVREFQDDVEVFGVRFANDPNAPSAPPILVQTENPDTSYWRLSGGLSAQFAHGISAYIEYQRLQSYQFMTFDNLSFGLRMQKGF